MAGSFVSNSLKRSLVTAQLVVTGAAIGNNFDTPQQIIQHQNTVVTNTFIVQNGRSQFADTDIKGDLTVTTFKFPSSGGPVVPNYVLTATDTAGSGDWIALPPDPWQPGVPAGSRYYSAGFIGIGTTNPQTNLHVIGSEIVSGDLRADTITLTGTSRINATNDLVFSNGGTVMTLDSTGKLGINITPTEKLDVNGNIKLTGDLKHNTNTFTFPTGVTTDEIVTLTNTQTLTNKTLVSPTISTTDTNDVNNIQIIGKSSVSGTMYFSSGATITGIPMPVNDSDVANRQYVDDTIMGLAWKQAVDEVDALDPTGLTAYPNLPFKGRYIVGATGGTATGAWLGKELNIAVLNDSNDPTNSASWEFESPDLCDVVCDIETKTQFIFTQNDTNTPPIWTVFGGGSGVSDHGLLTPASLLDDDHTQYALLSGRSGGQVYIGGTAASNNLTLNSTSNATKGFVLLNSAGGNVGINKSSPTYQLDVDGDAHFTDNLFIETGTIAIGQVNTDTNDISVRLHINNTLADQTLRISSAAARSNTIELTENYAGTDGGFIQFNGSSIANPGYHFGLINDSGGKTIIQTLANLPIIGSGVGIGTTEPKVPLHIVATDAANGDQLMLNDVFDTSDGLHIGHNSGTSLIKSKGAVALDIISNDGNGSTMTLFAAGQIGINTLIPAATSTLDIKGHSLLNDAIVRIHSKNNTSKSRLDFIANDTDGMRVEYNGTSGKFHITPLIADVEQGKAITILSNKNVGIATSTPQEVLTVAGNVGIGGNLVDNNLKHFVFPSLSGTSDELVTLTATQTLSNKTFDAPSFTGTPFTFEDVIEANSLQPRTSGAGAKVCLITQANVGVCVSETATGAKIDIDNSIIVIADNDTNTASLGTNKVGIFQSSPLVSLDICGSTRIKNDTDSVLTGSIDPTASTAVVGVGTLFLSELAVGDRIVVSGETRTVTAVTDNTNLTVDTAFSDNANDTSVDKKPFVFHVTQSSIDSNASALIINDDGCIGVGQIAPNHAMHVSKTVTDNWSTKIENGESTILVAHEDGLGLSVNTSTGSGSYIARFGNTAKSNIMTVRNDQTIDLNGGIKFATTVLTGAGSTLTLDTSHYFIICNQSSGTTSIELPDISGGTDYEGQVFIILAKSATTVNITLVGGGDSIFAGSAHTGVTLSQNARISLLCDGIDTWYTI